MFLKQFYETHDNSIRIPAHQASTFAKEIAHDFNPLHDADAKRFCVPGDLLFSLVLASQFYPGLSMMWWILLGVVMSFGCLKWQYATEQKALAVTAVETGHSRGRP